MELMLSKIASTCWLPLLGRPPNAIAPGLSPTLIARGASHRFCNRLLVLSSSIRSLQHSPLMRGHYTTTPSDSIQNLSLASRCPFTVDSALGVVETCRTVVSRTPTTGESRRTF